jgi:hypothetical protein
MKIENVKWQIEYLIGMYRQSMADVEVHDKHSAKLHEVYQEVIVDLQSILDMR